MVSYDADCDETVCPAGIEVHFTGSAVFVSVDDEGKKRPHGLRT